MHSGDQEKADESQRNKLRALRLWHWNKILEHRRYATRLSSVERHYMAQIADDLADEHLGFVQTLNGFFPIDDTAEKDAAK